eukprot:gnl/Spiro4/16054_TR8629_c0_g1_i1.p1 gnl/Spiro4/16054_TR8629_c0_g1~~gnl/Spiro4/16054_TR8629_c0_g1_i1.p1  ORF type:complete len:382 (+),score=46.81 gnl/Spiro4/16054_TR8629_c0_g1_i1:37-1146(+)
MHASPPIRRLILHFDLNKTLIAVDPAAGRTTEDVLNELIAARAWGAVAGSTWTASGHFSLEPPPDRAPGRDFMLFSDFVEEQNPYCGGPDAGDLNRAVRLRRSEMKKGFTEHAGSRFKAQYDQLLRAITTRSGGYHYVLPSFYRLVKHLVAQRRAFKIVLRTFGDDLDQVVEQFGAFCRGTHPDHPDVGHDAYAHLAPPRNYIRGAFFRNGPTFSNIALALGTTEKAPISVGTEHYHRRPSVTLLTEPHQILSLVLDPSTNFLALRDYFEWWNERGEASDSGKLLLVDPADPENHQIFIDDNIVPDKNIVDARHAVTGQPLPYEYAINRFLVKCDTYRAILEEDYFIKLIEMCERNLTEAGESSAQSTD